MDPSAIPLTERQRFWWAAFGHGLPIGWADRVWDRWDLEPWATLELALGSR